MSGYLSDSDLNAIEWQRRIITQLTEDQRHNETILQSLTVAQRLELLEMFPNDQELSELVIKVDQEIASYQEEAAQKKPGASLKPLAEVEDDEIKWLWYPYIQANNITVLRGDGGTGKTFLSCAIMSAVTNEFIPCDMPGSVEVHGNVIYFGKEDDAFITKARVKGAGGDLNKIFIFPGEIELSETETLRALIKDTSAKLIIFDPLQSFLGAGVDMNRANEIRPIMDRLREVARYENCGILIIEHLNKATQQKALFRGIGSIDIVSASRSVLMVGYHPITEDTRVMLQIKSNSKRGTPVAFKIDSEGSFSWEGTAQVTEDEMLTACGVFSQTKRNDPLLEGIEAIVRKHPAGWKGTASEMFVEISNLTGVTILTPETIGKRIPGITPLLNKEGISWSKRRLSQGFTYEIYKQNSVGS